MNLFLRFMALILNLLQWIADTYTYLFKEIEKKSVPTSDDPILMLSATDLAEKIRKRKIYCQEVINSYIRRIKEVNPLINAVVEDRFEAALEEAKELDEFLNHNINQYDYLKANKPLLGVPITIKESIGVKGLSHSGCSNLRKHVKASRDSTAVKYLKEAGAIPLLVSNTPEYCFCGDTNNKVIGYTCNPYNSLHSAGGSSGGEGALVGAAASILGIGSDLAGSVRCPCAFNGCFGHKPTKRIVPLEGHFPYKENDEDFKDFLTFGPITRFAKDMKLALKIIIGPDAAKLRLDDKVDLSQIKVYIMEDCGNTFFLLPTCDELKNAIQTAATYLNNKCTVSEEKFLEFRVCYEIVSSIFTEKEPPNPVEDFGHGQHVFIEFLKEILFGKSLFSMEMLMCALAMELNKYAPYNYKKYVKKGKELKEKLMETLGTNGVFIFPCFPTGAFKRGGYIGSIPMGSYMAVFSYLGLPTTSVPVGFTKEGLPIGVQVVAGPYQDKLTLAIAEELEKCFGGWKPAAP